MSVKIYDNIVLFGKDVYVWNREKQESEKSDLLDFYVSDENNKNTLATGKIGRVDIITKTKIK